MKSLLLVFAIDVLVLSIYALPQEDAPRVEPTPSEPNGPTSDESAAAEPTSDYSEVGETKEVPFKGDEFTMEESAGDEIANQDGFLERAAQEPVRPLPRPTPNIPCTTYTEAGRNQRQDAIDVCEDKGINHPECVRKFCSAANGPTLGCNSNCTRCPPNHYQYNNDYY